MDTRPNTCLLSNAKNYPLVAVPSTCTRKLTTLLLVHMNPVNVGKVTGTGSKSNELIKSNINIFATLFVE